MISSVISTFRNISSIAANPDFTRLNKLLLHMFRIISVTQNKLHLAYDYLFNNLTAPSITLLCIECALFAVTLVIVCFSFSKLSKRLIEILTILITPNIENANIIKDYWIRVKNLQLASVKGHIESRSKITTEKHK